MGKKANGGGRCRGRKVNGSTGLCLLRGFTYASLRRMKAVDDAIHQDIAAFVHAFDGNDETSSLRITRSSGLGKLALVLRILTNQGNATVDVGKTIEICLQAIDVCCVSPSNLIDRSAIELLANKYIGLLLRLLHARITPWRLFCRIAETASALVDRVCLHYGNDSQLETLLAPAIDEKKAYALGELVGCCGNGLIQGNIVEMASIAIRGLNGIGKRDAALRFSRSFCRGLISKPEVVAPHADMLVSLSLGNDVESSVDSCSSSVVFRIRQWMNTVNGDRVNQGHEGVVSFRAKKVLIGNDDKDCPSWVDFNRTCIVINGSDTLCIAIEYNDIVQAQGKGSASTVCLNVRSATDLLEESCFHGPQDVRLEFQRSDFKAVGSALRRANVHCIAVSDSEHTARSTGKCGVHPLGSRKASIAFSNDVLEYFLNSDPLRMAKSQQDARGLQENGGLPLDSAASWCTAGTPEMLDNKAYSPKRCKGDVAAAIGECQERLKRICTEQCNALDREGAVSRKRVETLWQSLLKKHQDDMLDFIDEAIRQLEDKLLATPL
ncbi:Uncharacterized protein PBTT_06239 [Plasmodiophora brassicae]|uniref:Uncharacterized protein n=1 Tax=Plasmodiophora brassicae TaxID=37360 RepID=A0A0G4IUR6_PLABS|nr:hypothetical protein PBRA_007096 [Plasmodiophora brassicae]SPQ98538.1 unnamed protein product [Plasmodiophora brassicae]